MHIPKIAFDSFADLKLKTSLLMQEYLQKNTIPTFGEIESFVLKHNISSREKVHLAITIVFVLLNGQAIENQKESIEELKKATNKINNKIK